MDIGDDVVDCRHLIGPADSAMRCAALVESLPRDCDALLLVGGIDGQDEPANTVLLNYLLCGSLDAQLGFPQLEDTMLVLSRSYCFIYTTPPALQHVARLTSGWPNTEVLCQSAEAFGDQFVFEEHKMSCFRRIVEPFRSFAVVFDETVSRSGTDTVKVIEKWPIVQSYAVHDLGQRPFFTMAKRVRNVFHDAASVLGVLRKIDALEAQRIALQDASMLRFQWCAALEGLDRNRREISEDGLQRAAELVLEPLQAFFKYGKLANPLSVRHIAASNGRGSVDGTPAARAGVVSLGPTNAAAAAAPVLVLSVHSPRGTLKVERTYPLVVDASAATVLRVTSAIAAALSPTVSSLDAAEAAVMRLPGTIGVALRVEREPLDALGAVFVSVVVERAAGENTDSNGECCCRFGDTFLEVAGEWVNTTNAIVPCAAFACSRAEAEGARAAEGALTRTIGAVADEVGSGDGVKMRTINGISAAVTVVIAAHGLLLRSRRLGVLGPLSLAAGDGCGGVAIEYHAGHLTEDMLVRFSAAAGDSGSGSGSGSGSDETNFRARKFLDGAGGAVFLVLRPSSHARRVVLHALTAWKSTVRSSISENVTLSLPPLALGPAVEGAYLVKANRPARPQLDTTPENLDASCMEQRRYLRSLLEQRGDSGGVARWPTTVSLATSSNTSGGGSSSSSSSGGISSSALRVIVLSMIPGTSRGLIEARLQTVARRAGSAISFCETWAAGATATAADPSEISECEVDTPLVEDALRRISASSPGSILVLVCPPFASVAGVLGAVHSCWRSGVNVALHSVIAAIPTGLFYRDYTATPPRHVAPAISAALMPGLVTHLLFLTKTGTSQYLSRIEAAVRHAHEHGGVAMRSFYSVDDLNADFLADSGALPDETAQAILHRAAPSSRTDILHGFVHRQMCVKIEREPLSSNATFDFLGCVRGGSSGLQDIELVEADVVLDGRRTRLAAAAENTAFSFIEEGELDPNLLHTFRFLVRPLAAGEASKLLTHLTARVGALKQLPPSSSPPKSAARDLAALD